MRIAIFPIALFTYLSVLACGGSQSSTESPPEAQPTPEAAAPPTEGAPSRPQMTAEACESSGGSVVGDIGDGAIHRPEYRCPSGAAPTGSIQAAEGGPIAVEGSVCCPK